MRTSGRSSVAAFHCLLSLAALNCKTSVASGLPTKASDGGGDSVSVPDELIRLAASIASVNIAADGSIPVRQQDDGDSASVAAEHLRTDPPKPLKATVHVGADGSVLVRQQDVHSHKMSTGGGDGDWDFTAFDDVDRADDDLVRARRNLISAEEFAEGRLGEDALARVSDHAQFHRDAAAKQKLTGETWEDVLTVFCVIFMIVGAIALLVFLCFFNKKSPGLLAQQPAVVWMPSQPEDTDPTTSPGDAGGKGGGTDKGKGKGAGPPPEQDDEEDDTPGSKKSEDQSQAPEAKPEGFGLLARTPPGSPKVPERVGKEDSDDSRPKP